MASCIFQGTSPSISPLDFNVQLPSYESCWIAKTADECLESLQSMPQQILVSTAIRNLQHAPSNGSALFEASGFAMFVLLKGRYNHKLYWHVSWRSIGLHCILFQAITYETNYGSKSVGTAHASAPGSQSNDIMDLDSFLQHDLSGSTVSSLADAAMFTNSTSALGHINQALNTWRNTWDQRQFREHKYENCTFFNDPLPFWWLAKLYILLHVYADLLHPDSEFAVARARSGDETSKFQVQKKIVGWFSRFRKTWAHTEAERLGHSSLGTPLLTFPPEWDEP